MADGLESFDFVSARSDEDIENLVTGVYHKFRLRISRDDPLLAMYYINAYMAGRLEVSMRQVMEDYVRRLSDVTEKLNSHSLEKANKIINGAIGTSGRIISSAVKDTAIAIRDETKKGVADVHYAEDAALKAIGHKLNDIKNSDKTLRRSMTISAYVSAVAALAAFAALAVAFLR
jgi:hypothetical protein